MSKKLHELVLGDIEEREEWAKKQSVWYQMRHAGLRRRSKPFPGAADLHFPLCDSMIDKWKPFYFQQLYGTETIATFISKDREHEGFTAELEYHFDYKLKQESNLAKAFLVAIDKMLQSGTECVKVFWDAGEKRVAFDALEPTRCIVPWHTKELTTADRFVHVMEVSVPQYKANPNYRQEPDFIKKITGDGSDKEGSADLDREKKRREGITDASSSNLILLWEVWERCVGGAEESSRKDAETQRAEIPDMAKPQEPQGIAEALGDDGLTGQRFADRQRPILANSQGMAAALAGDGLVGDETRARGTAADSTSADGAERKPYYKVHTFSPLAPEEAVRPTIKNPYDHGRLPFVRFEHEVKDQGHYDSRGIPEIAGAFETSITKSWNDKHDFMAFVNRPMFTSEKEIPNAGNISMQPGMILGFNIKRVEMGAPPVSFDEEIQSTRQIAEYRVGMPDFGTGQAQEGGPKTATEVERIGGLLNQGVDLRSHMVRLSLAELFQQAFQLLLQFDRSTQYVRENAMKELPPEAMVDAYRVQPKGSSDSWNRAAKLQKAIVRKQLLCPGGMAPPWINGAEVDKSIIELDDPKLVKKLWIDPDMKAQNEAEDEMTLIPALMYGAPLPAKQGQDHVARIKTLVQFLEQRGAAGVPVDPIGINGIKMRIDSQMAALAQADPKMGQQVGAELAQMFAAHGGGQPGQALPGQQTSNIEHRTSNIEGGGQPAATANVPRANAQGTDAGYAPRPIAAYRGAGENGAGGL